MVGTVPHSSCKETITRTQRRASVKDQSVQQVSCVGQMPPMKDLSLETLSSCFGMTAKEAAVKLGLCVTSLKKIMRKHGISRWPFRKLKSLNDALSQQVGEDKALEATAASALCTLSASTPLSNPSPEPPCSAKKACNQEASLISEEHTRKAAA